ncbi:MAG: NlpC/P60 family protein [Pseudomonadota bacterium]
MTGNDVAACARAWIGTPYVLGAALKGAGCDCVGLIRGVFEDVTGRPAERPRGWRRDWAAGPGLPMLAAARRNLIACPFREPRAGDVVGFRVGLGEGRLAHCGIVSAPGRVVHALERVGVVEVGLRDWRPSLAFVFVFPGVESAGAGCEDPPPQAGGASGRP